VIRSLAVAAVDKPFGDPARTIRRGYDDELITRLAQIQRITRDLPDVRDDLQECAAVPARELL